MTRDLHPGPAPRSRSEDDPAVYSGRAGKGPSPFAIFLIATFWLGVIGGATMFFSLLWGSIILGIAAITLICALLNAG